MHICRLHRHRYKNATHIFVYIWLCIHMVFPGSSRVKNLPAMRETQVRFLDQEDTLEKGMTTHSSILAWWIPWTEEPGRPQSHIESDTNEELTHTHMHTYVLSLKCMHLYTHVYVNMLLHIYRGMYCDTYKHICAMLYLVAQWCPALCNPNGL